jgi:hypothetical protein
MLCTKHDTIIRDRREDLGQVKKVKGKEISLLQAVEAPRVARG